MINYNEMYTQKTNDAFANIEKAGIYKGRLIAVKITEQDPKYVDPGKDPKKLICFLWDVLNKDGNHVHVSTKPCTISFTDKSTLPFIWGNVEKITSLDTYLKTVYDKNNKVKDIFALLDIKVDEKENGFYPTVTKVSQLEDPINNFEVTAITDYDKKVYGKPVIDMDINPVYEGKQAQEEVADDDDDLFRRLNEK